MTETNVIADGLSKVITTSPLFSAELIGATIPVIVPLLIAVWKLLLPRIPTWALPLLAPVLGFAINAVLTYANGTGVNPWVAAALGSAGVGLREIVDQLKQSELTKKTIA